MAAIASLPEDSPLAAPADTRRTRSRLVRELLWRRVDVPGIEYFRLWASPAGPRLTGTVILADAGSPLRLKYAVACAPDWTSRGVHVALTRGAVTRHLKLTAGDGQRWWRSAEEAPPGAGPHREAAREGANAGAGAGSAAGVAGGSPRPVPAAMEIP